jgi:hypothetical protein
MQTLAFDYIGKAQPVLAAPELSRQLALLILGALVAALLLRGLLIARRDGGTLMLILACILIGSGMEGFAEHIAMVYQPELGTVQAYHAWGKPVPLHVVLAYVAYFGVTSHGLLGTIQRGVPAAWWWRAFAMGSVACLLADWLAIHTGIWLHHGPQVLVVWKLPIWIMFTNTATVFAFAAAMHLCLAQLRGAQRLYALFLAPLAMVMVCLGISFGASTALFSDLGETARIAWSLGSIATSFAVMQVCIVYFGSQAGVRVDRW